MGECDADPLQGSAPLHLCFGGSSTRVAGAVGWPLPAAATFGRRPAEICRVFPWQVRAVVPAPRVPSVASRDGLSAWRRRGARIALSPLRCGSAAACFVWLPLFVPGVPAAVRLVAGGGLASRVRAGIWWPRALERLSQVVALRCASVLEGGIDACVARCSGWPSSGQVAAGFLAFCLLVPAWCSVSHPHAMGAGVQGGARRRRGWCGLCE